MQTFLPYSCFTQTARVLDPRRRNNQRSEAQVLLKTLLGLYPEKNGRPGGWPRHPATKMWAGHEKALCRYALSICAECPSAYLVSFFAEWRDRLPDTGDPSWLGVEDFHRSHRSNLLRKKPEWYRLLWPSEIDNLPYIWPRPERRAA